MSIVHHHNDRANDIRRSISELALKHRTAFETEAAPLVEELQQVIASRPSAVIIPLCLDEGSGP